MIKVFTGVQFTLSLAFTILLWFAPDLGWVECGSPEMIGAIGMADFMWLLTLVLVLISLAKHEKEQHGKGSRNY